jgi:ferredoxin-NADP reductase
MGFLGLMFWHCNNMLTSWHYLIAAFTIWVGCLVYRLFFRTNFLRAFHGEQAHFTTLSDDGVKVTIPTTLRWEAGQHVFLRVPGISLLDNHPFTVASVATKPEGEYNDLVLVFKPQKGFTRRVFDIARKDPDNSYRAYLDGPYGGLARKLESFETVVLIAGGSGITPIIGHLYHLAAKIRAKEAVTRDVRIIWTVKHFDAFEWFKDEVSKIARTMPRNSLLVQYFATQEAPVPLLGPSFPLSATRDWPVSPRTPGTPMTPIFAKAEPLHGVRETLDEEEYELRVLSMRKELGHDLNPDNLPRQLAGKDNEENPPHAITKDESILESPRSVKSIPPPMGDEVLLEFGRPPLREALRQWSEGFGKRACVYGMFFSPPAFGLN